MRGFFLSHGRLRSSRDVGVCSSEFLFGAGSMDTVELTLDVSTKLTEYTTILVAGAEAGDAEEQHFLGRCYRHGFGTFKVDHDKANKWMKKASDGGLLQAKKDLQHFFGMLLFLIALCPCHDLP